jgi:hypothetical protein
LKASKRKGEDDEVSNEGALDFGYQLLMECENENSEYLNDFLADVIHKICIYPFFLVFRAA